MKNLRIVTYHVSRITLLFALVLTAGCGQKIELPTVNVDAKGAVILDATNGRVLFAKNPDGRFPPASTTKIMTAIVAIESLSPDADVIPSKKATYVEPTLAGLKAGVKYKLNDLLATILIKSGNDAATAIAEAVAGSEKAFAEKMNTKAAILGMDNTYFATASGLPTGKKDSQYTTARDLAVMMRYAMRYKPLLEHMSRKDAVIYGSDGGRIYLKTHNRSLLMRQDGPWGKTGYTKEASRTFAGCDASESPSIVFGLLKSEKLWDDIFTLNDKGLEIFALYRRTWVDDLKERFSAFLDWIRGQRLMGRREVEAVYSSAGYTS